jgi:hypothetical protein
LGHDEREEREPGYLLAAGANPLTANLLNFITLSLAGKREGMRELGSPARGFFRGGLFRRTPSTGRAFLASAERLEFIARKRRFQRADAKIA